MWNFYPQITNLMDIQTLQTYNLSRFPHTLLTFTTDYHISDLKSIHSCFSGPTLQFPREIKLDLSTHIARLTLFISPDIGMKSRVITPKQFLMLFNPIRKIIITQFCIRIILHIDIMLAIDTSCKLFDKGDHVRILDLIGQVIAVNLVVGTFVMNV